MRSPLVISLPLLWTLSSFASPARAEPELRRERLYLAELALVLDGVRGILLWAETHPGDLELARFVHPLSEQYVALASRLIPTKALASAHPHVLIVAENAERAIDAAAHGEGAAFRQHLRTVREELATLEAVLKHLKLRLPEVAP